VPGCLPPEQPAPHPGRYHAAGDPWPLYAALDRDTMWAEWAHASDAPRRPDDDSRWVCELEADLTVLDLRQPATRRALRVGVPGLTGPWSPDSPNRDARRVARAVAELGVDGAVVPSAAAAGGWNLFVLPRAFERVRMRRRRRETAPASAGRPGSGEGG
jgi:RES domain-containing protein